MSLSARPSECETGRAEASANPAPPSKGLAECLSVISADPEQRPRPMRGRSRLGNTNLATEQGKGSMTRMPTRMHLATEQGEGSIASG